ncbi:WD40-repeat-containing domain protein [Polychytrium aggregatum]|uniref:WD40-repeat-containing domain protein n=1 Tax=Polychytrium aggregatum TaxID=110093 RepID=UPI0022FE633B|nr:WD40-repeat-containing domain protein [Polychytrium aggregatum]KAI9204650.1 WD40-repeat-containing domain protein [Polychytrium aggregatum]
MSDPQTSGSQTIASSKRKESVKSSQISLKKDPSLSGTADHLDANQAADGKPKTPSSGLAKAESVSLGQKSEASTVHHGLEEAASTDVQTTAGQPRLVAGGEIQVDGIMPLFLTGTTQEMFKIKGGEDLTLENPMRMIPKADLLADIHARAAISDFSPAKQIINEYPQEELLVHWDPEFKYGQNFFLFIKPEAVEILLKPIVVEAAPEELQASVTSAKKEKERHKWECLGSDKEIDAERMENTRPLINIRMSRKRRDFLLSCKFGDRDASDGFLECKPFRDPTYDITRMELPKCIQAVAQLIDATIQTTWSRATNASVQYEPAMMNSEEQELLFGSESFYQFIHESSPMFEHAIQQNEIMDIFIDEYKELGEEDATIEQGAHAQLQEYQSFTDLKHSKDRSISCVDWHPIQTGVVAISCAHRLTFDDRVESGLMFRAHKSLLLIWSFHDPIHPQLILEAPDDIMCFKFNPRDTNIIAGGCINGQIILWDIAEYEDKLKTNRKAKSANEDTSGNKVISNRHVEMAPIKYFAVSSIELSHKGPISDLHWLPKNMELNHSGEFAESAENGHKQLITASVDGHVAFWDTRAKKELKALDLVWKPFLRVPLSAMDNTYDYGLTKISIRTQITTEKSGSGGRTAKKATPGNGFSSKFYCATEEGDLIYADWVAEKTTEEKASRVEHAFNCHFGPMSDVQRSPFFPDVVLSVGGWSFHIWKEKIVIGPLLSSPPSQAYMICGRWSPTRPGVFYISKSDGTIEIWDLLDQSHLPITVQNVSSIAISYMTIHQYPNKSQMNSQFIAVGDDEGTLHILEVPRNLSKPVKNERSIIQTFFDREVRRLSYVKGRKEIRISEKPKWEQAAIEASLAQKRSEEKKVEEKNPEEEEEKAEKEYRAMERSFLEAEGLLPPEEPEAPPA